jgi:MFS family permease
LRLLAVGVAAFAFFGAAATATFVLFARDRLGVSEAAFGLVLAFGAAGFVAGGLVGGRLHDRLPPGPLVVGAGAVAGVAYLVVGLTTAVWVATVALAVEGFAISTANTATLALRQRLVPSELLGRVGNAFRVLVVGVAPVGALVGGLVATADLRFPWLVAGVAQIAVAAALTVPLCQQLDSRPATVR